MPTCNICLEDLKDPVCIPCGHVYCASCLIRTINATQPYSELMHHCPTCRGEFVFTLPDPSTIPSHLKAYVTPSVRRLYLDPSSSTDDGYGAEGGPSTPTPSRSTPSPTPTAPTDAEYNRLLAENASLRVHLEKWRTRAEIHGSANLSFLHLTKTAKYAAMKCQREKEEIQRKYDNLVQKVEMMAEPVSQPSRAQPGMPLGWEFRPPILEDELLGPPTKKRRRGEY